MIVPVEVTAECSTQTPRMPAGDDFSTTFLDVMQPHARSVDRINPDKWPRNSVTPSGHPPMAVPASGGWTEAAFLRHPAAFLDRFSTKLDRFSTTSRPVLRPFSTGSQPLLAAAVTRGRR
jgi:hypothetical protein